MEFKKKLRTRLYVAISYIILGAAMIATAELVDTAGAFLSSFGFAIIVMGLVRVWQYRRITKTEESIRAREIVETDERNLTIARRAAHAAFSIYILLGGCSVIALQIAQKQELSQMLAWSMCALVVFYWVSHWVIRKKI